MVFILINWLVNGLFLSFVYAGICLLSAKHSICYTQIAWLMWALGYGTSWCLTLLGVSQLGNYLLRVLLGARYATKRERQKLQPLLDEVLAHAKCYTASQLPRVQLLVKDSKEPVAQVCGSNGIMLSDGLLHSATDDELRAVLAHECGHLYYKDGIVLQAIIFGGLVLWLIMAVYALYTVFSKSLLKYTAYFKIEGVHLLLLFALLPFLIFLPLIGLNWLGKRLIDFGLLFMLRRCEYKADQFASALGYRAGLVSFLEKMQSSSEYDNSIIGRILASYPSPMLRIDRLENSV